jgi:hypothetical protein
MVLVSMVVLISRNVHWEVVRYQRDDSVSECIQIFMAGSRSFRIFLNASRRCATRKIIHHDNGNILNQISMDINLLNINLSDEI